MTGEDDFQRLLHDAAEQIPAGNAPIAQLVREGRRSKSRRNIVQAVSVAAAVALIAVGAFILQPSLGGSGNLATQPTTSPSRLDVPPGTRLVGMNGVAVAVPEAWSTNDTNCGQALSDTVDFTDTLATDDCQVPGSEDFSRLRAVPLTSQWGQVWADNGQTVDLQGIHAERVPTRCEDSQNNTGVSCNGTLVVPSLNAVMYVESPNREVVDAVLDSASSIPEGYTAVPDLAGLYSDSDVEPLVESARLLWEDRCPDGSCNMPLIEATNPAVGSVVPSGTTVRVAHRPDQEQPSVPASVPPGVNAQALTELDLLGQWRVVGELEQQLQSAGFPDESKVLEFSQRDDKFLLWEGNDECNLWGGRFEVGADGAFSANNLYATVPGCGSPGVVTVPEVVMKATGVRLNSGQLQLFDGEDALLATFERLEATSAPTTPATSPSEKGARSPVLALRGCQPYGQGPPVACRPTTQRFVSQSATGMG